MLTDRLRAARFELDASKFRIPSPAPSSPACSSRQFECRIERSGLLWFPVLTARDEDKLVVGVSSGLPHCVRCVRPLRLVSDRVEEWVCESCGARRPGKDADLMSTDLVLAEVLREFFARHPDFTPALELSAPNFETADAA
jgi:hypothetical protein